MVIGALGEPSDGHRIIFIIDTTTTEIYPLSLHDALPICLMSSASTRRARRNAATRARARSSCPRSASAPAAARSEEHTSELQSQSNLVCRLLLEKKKIKLCIVVIHRSRRQCYTFRLRTRR